MLTIKFQFDLSVFQIQRKICIEQKNERIRKKAIQIERKKMENFQSY
jgi:hypothetical protein